MGIQDHIGIFLFLHEIFPCHQFKAIVDHHVLIFWHISTDAVVGIQVKLPQEFHSDRCRTFCQLRIYWCITILHIHGLPHVFCNRLI